MRGVSTIDGHDAGPHEIGEIEVIILSRRTEADGVVTLELGLPSGDPLPSWDSLCGRAED